MRVAFQWLNAVLEVFMEIYYGCVTCACYFVFFFFSPMSSKVHGSLLLSKVSLSSQHASGILAFLFWLEVELPVGQWY